MFEYSPTDLSNQIAALPPQIFWWLRTLAIFNVMSIFWIKRVQARWILAAIVFIAFTNVPIFLSLGLVKLGSIPHLLVWIPLLVYLAREIRLGRVDVKTTFGVWCFAVILLNLTSVVFDLRDGIQYLLGDTAPMTAATVAKGFPIATTIAIFLSYVAVAAYALRLDRLILRD